MEKGELYEQILLTFYEEILDLSSIISSGHRINLLITLFQRKGYTIISVVLIVLAKIARILAKLFLDAENPMIQNTLMEDLISSRLAHVKLTCATVKRK